jgi:hypothetical protein
MTNQQLTYHVDLVFCIDATGSMTHIIKNVKQNALEFHSLLQQRLNGKNKFVDVLRVRVLAFRDYYDDGIPPMVDSEFFILPQHQSAFKQFMNTIEPIRGYSNEESGLEALALAIQSNWTTGGNRRRHVILLWTDASAHRLELLDKPADYPSGIPADFDALTDLWNDEVIRSKAAKRLGLFAPDVQPWTEIGYRWSNVIHVPTKAGDGMKDEDNLLFLDGLFEEE